MSASQLDIKAFLDQDEKKDLLRLLTAGSVDDGKSTLIGRLLFDSKKLYEDQLTALEDDSKRMGHAGEDIDYALLLDGLKAEREQGITIDVAYRYFSTNKRKFIIADTPGHEQYTRNMVTGGSTANLAIILVDATKGVITQTKRHTFLTSLLGIKHVILAVNKMDLVDYSEERFNEIVEEYEAFITRLDIPDVHFIPLSALKGENVVEKSKLTPWYEGKSVLRMLETIHIASDRNFIDMRFPVQYVIRPDKDFRGFAGKVASGIVRKGEVVMALPSGKKSRIKEIITYEGKHEEAFPPQSVTITLEDEIDISRGDMLIYPNNRPKVERHFEAMLVWMDEEKMNTQQTYIIKHNTHSTKVNFEALRYKIDVNTLHKTPTDHLELNEIGRVVLSTFKPLFFDAYRKNRATGAFILIDPITHNTCAVGMLIDRVAAKNLPHKISDSELEKIDSGRSLIAPEQYENKYNQKAETIWLTGLHGCGKNELAYIMERELFEIGAKVVLLDGATLRNGLSRELDFSPEDRDEHLRRVAHICKLLNDQGIITICSFISPTEKVRNEIAGIIGEDKFHVFFVDTDLETCKKRQPALYEKAAKGEIYNLAGIDLTYETPKKNLVETLEGSLEEKLTPLMDFVKEKLLK